MKKSRSVPSSRAARLGSISSMAGKVAGNVIYNGAKSLLKGDKITIKNLLLTPKNVEYLADQLAHLRGAAMKLGQLLSMDAGEILSPELAMLLEKLQASAQPMPHKQLVGILKSQWGDNWLDTLSYMDLQSFAAASIGQVHEAYTENGQKLAIKVQYPGIEKSVESDVDNVISLLKLSGLLPHGVNVDTLINEAKQQLLDEADYQREGRYLEQYKLLLNNDPNFIVPCLYKEYSTDKILAMEYVEGDNIDALQGCSQQHKNRIFEKLLVLFFMELFEFKTMQTDPNFANYQYQSTTQKIVLLDFGASRIIPEHISKGYLKLLQSALNGDRHKLIIAAKEIGYFDGEIDEDYTQNIIDIFMLACSPLCQQGVFDFSNSELATKIKENALQMSTHVEKWHTPPVDALFIHRKLAGLYLLAVKLNVSLDVRMIWEQFLSNTNQIK